MNNYSEEVKKVADEMFPPVVQVYNLIMVEQGSDQLPKVISCSSMTVLRKMFVGILRKSDKVEPRFKAALELYSKDIDGYWEQILDTYDAIKEVNQPPIKMELVWEDEPQVLL